MYEGKEKRRYRRVRAEVGVDIEQYDSEPMLLATSVAASKNVSVGGLLVRFDESVSVPATVLVRFSLPGEEDKLEIVGRTTRCLPVEGGFDVGLEFLDCMPEQADKIKKYIRAEKEGGPKS